MSVTKRFLLVSPVLEARTRLRETLKAIKYDADVEVARTTSEAIAKLNETALLDFAFLSYAGATEPLEQVLHAAEPLGLRKPIFVVVLPNPQVDATHVAELFARGVDGFIAEPYSSGDLDDLFKALSVGFTQDQNVSRNMRLLGFLTSRLQLKLDELADIQATRENVITKLPRSFSPLKEVLAKLYESDPERYEKILISKYEDLPPPKPNRRKIKRKAIEDVVHPGVRVKKLIAQRQIETERITTLLVITEEDLVRLFDGRLSVDEGLATNLARALGETARYWLELQKTFDKARGDQLVASPQ